MANEETPFVIVEWLDAHADFETVTTLDAKLTHKPTVMLTAGWLLLQDEHGISIAAERCPSDNSYRARTFIPAGMVKTVTPYRLAQPRRRRAAQSKQSPAQDLTKI